jgi:signal transduction histidine kinase
MLAAVLVTLIAGGWGLHVMERQFRVELANRLETGLSAMAAGVEGWRSKRLREVQAWAGHDEVVAALALHPGPGRTKALQHLSSELAFSGKAMGYLGYWLVDDQGRVVLPAGAASPDALEERELVKGALSGRSWVTHPFMGRLAETPDPERALLSVAAPVRREDGSAMGVLVLRMPGDALGRQLEGGQPGRSGETLAFDRSGRLLSDSRFEDQLRGAGLIGSDPAKDRALLQLVLRDPGGDIQKGFTPDGPPGTWLLTRDVTGALTGKAGADLEGFRDYRGVKVVGSWRWLDGMDMGLATEMDAPEAFEPLAAVRRVMFSGLLLLLAASILSVWFWAKEAAQGRRRARAEAKLRRLNRELEGRVSQRTAQLEIANKELEAFAYSVSHDLRAPLRGIDGFSQALMEDYGDQMDDTGRHYLSRVRAGTQRMGVLIDDLLRLSRVSRAQMQWGPVDLGAAAKAVLDELRQQDPGRQVSVRIETGLQATGDAHLLRIVLDNLLSNAWKYTSRHATARIEVGAAEKEGGRAFFVKDDGAGFDMAYAHKLFGVFQRLHGADEFPGTGVGLATVARIIHRHGGRIWAESAPEKGATFFFTLPEEGP